MKKVTFLFVGIIYVIAIILVAFLGVQAEIANRTVPVENVLLAEAKDLPKGSAVTYPSGSSIKECIYALYTRPEEEDITMDDKGMGTATMLDHKVTWNDLAEGKYDYVYEIRDFRTVADSTTWRDGPMHFNVAGIVLPADATMKELRYTITDDGGVTTKAEIDPRLGVITFKEKFTKSNTDFYVHMRPTDNATISRTIKIRVGKYKAA